MGRVPGSGRRCGVVGVEQRNTKRKNDRVAWRNMKLLRDLVGRRLATSEKEYSLRGSNPRPMAHKTIALTTELRER